LPALSLPKMSAYTRTRRSTIGAGRVSESTGARDEDPNECQESGLRELVLSEAGQYSRSPLVDSLSPERTIEVA
jgi:hypothetical protein